MMFLAALFLALWLATIFGKPPIESAPGPVQPMWRCVLRNKQVYDVAATTEADAMKALMKLKVDISKIKTLEPIV